MYKNFNLNGIITEGVRPTLSEIEYFEESPESADIDLIPASGVKDNSLVHNFSFGDKIEIKEGELMHLQGKVINIDGNLITIMPNHEELNEPIEFLAHELKKYFDIGDHVKVS